MAERAPAAHHGPRSLRQALALSPGAEGASGPRSRRSKDIGTEAERWVADYLRDHGFPGAERRAQHGAQDRGDITGTIGLAWEIKAGRAGKASFPKDVTEWMRQTEAERVNASADVGILVLARSGYGRARVGMWWALLPFGIFASEAPEELCSEPVWMTLVTACRWLRWNGYGERL